MKFLCVECDEAMKLQGTRGPEAGAMTVIFQCPACGKETAMLTNPMETQMVRSLGVKIGGRTVQAEPMEMLTGSLAAGVEPAREAAAADPHHGMQTAGERNGASKCPFTGMITEAYSQAEPGQAVSSEPAQQAIPANDVGDTAAAGKCPFTGTVTEAHAQEEATVAWSEEAEARVSRIPSFAQAMVRKSIEQHAKENGYAVIDKQVMDEVKGMFGM